MTAESSTQAARVVPLRTFQEYVNDLADRFTALVERDMPQEGWFEPVLAFMPNPDPAKREVVGKYGLRAYKMPPEIVADPCRRYVEAAAYEPSACYKADFVVAMGTKDEVLATLRSADFRLQLSSDFAELFQLLAYD